jgi:hypothetical protein
MLKYRTIVQWNDSESFDLKVNAALAEGWYASGSVAVATDDNGNVVYTLSMMKTIPA